MHQGRRQAEYHYPIPPQTHSPVHHNPYAAYQYPQYHGPPHAPSYHQQQQQQWYPYHQPQHPYQMPPRQFQPHASPIVASSYPHMQPMPPVNRQLGQTPPIVHSRTPPVPRNHTPQPVASTPSVASQTHVSSPALTHSTTHTPPPFIPRQSFTAPAQPEQTHKMPYYPALPWYSVPEAEFPPRVSQRRRKRAPVASTEQGLAFPTREETVTEEQGHQENGNVVGQASTEEREASQASTPAPVSDLETPVTSQAPSEADQAHNTTTQSLLSAVPQQTVAATPAAHARKTTKPVVPLIPIKPAVPASVTSTTPKSATGDKPGETSGEKVESKGGEAALEKTPEPTAATDDITPAPAPSKSAPKSWAELLRSKAAPAPAQAPALVNGAAATNGTSPKQSNSLADVLASFSVEADKVAFLKPRGLVNPGNLCYMNSVLQVLLFCVPFYGFLDQVAKRAVHSFKSETPLVDAMIMFMRDFPVIDSAESSEKLRLRLKDAELEQYGDPLTPEYVYEVIRRLPRFENMKRGQQEDAEEFLGFLLAGLHDECAHVIKSARAGNVSPTSPQNRRSGSVEGGWLEVGPKQKSAVTQTSGDIEFESPITKIFGGKLRSEYRKPGQQTSVTLEPYQPLQLDIGSPTIHNISDALKGLTHLETLQSDNTPRGGRPPTKQVFIETLPPVLILHLKRFHYDANGPQKIWKKIGYPLELEIPKEVFPTGKRSTLIAQGLPRYRLTAVVYHHGKNASGGHYTVDLRRQEGREWIRMDDTVIRRIRPEDVAEGGAEEDPKVLAAALEQHKKDASRSGNFYEQIGLGEEDEKTGEGWSQVNGDNKPSKENGTKKWSGVVNGTATPSSAGKRTPMAKENIKDNKVAYILFYEQIKV
ncbi:ubiquitin carboxyl-terminal hydrolase-like protein 10 [Delitschia confertaspora ATCC 74209]|uniref:Ubiquitin carboxyl-terminal hydrolase n=1 Tax=Delitschia confertaspora ATCC 74209 TaxID=1513339 RepID=A0A9P4JI38_9PLEO|nr:ubiquitin carboxyl-terminal hydrolase-like protein 10 [Delitschia confertaspora ATCC 74209]